jgi:hypothetical protein
MSTVKVRTSTKICKKCDQPVVRDTHYLCRDHYNEYMREWHQRDPEKRRGHNLRKYGITLNEYNDMLIEQGGVCAICKQPESATYKDGRVKNLAVDHDHVTDEVRGLLCQSCNTMLSGANDDPEVLEAGIEYLERVK